MDEEEERDMFGILITILVVASFAFGIWLGR